MSRRAFLTMVAAVLLVGGLLSGLHVLAATQGQGARGLERAIQAQEKHTEALMARKGVVGTAVGLDQDGEHVVKVYVEHAQARAGIPVDLDGVPVAVEVTGEILAMGDPNTSTGWCDRPVPIGVSTGHPAITAGTIGARVTDGTNVYALSNNHVYANENNATIGDNVLQPGTIDGGRNPADAIGTLYGFQAIVFNAGAKNTIDAAIALCGTDTLGNATPSDGYGTPSSVTVSAALYQPVKKYGRTTGLTSGNITAINATVKVGYRTGTARFVKQIVVESAGAFIQGGDSGSLLVTDDEENNPVGLLFAGNGSGTMAIANRIELVLDRFGVTIDGTAAPTPSVLHVSDIAMSIGTKTAGKNVLVSAMATVTVVDADDVPVAGATVSGHWVDATSDSDAGTTDADGTVSLQSNSLKKPSPGTTFTFVVDNVTKNGWTYEKPGTGDSGWITYTP
ncbi:MAG: hypothetical protein IMZ46_00035 [Acidobacteria bacterium]|nr:hypothetical protein [Acidobacteriota bacterium]